VTRVLLDDEAPRAVRKIECTLGKKRHVDSKRLGGTSAKGRQEQLIVVTRIVLVRHKLHAGCHSRSPRAPQELI
jgi:hypothetical protein